MWPPSARISSALTFARATTSSNTNRRRGRACPVRLQRAGLQASRLAPTAANSANAVGAPFESPQFRGRERCRGWRSVGLVVLRWGNAMNDRDHTQRPKQLRMGCVATALAATLVAGPTYAAEGNGGNGDEESDDVETLVVTGTRLERQISGAPVHVITREDRRRGASPRSRTPCARCRRTSAM